MYYYIDVVYYNMQSIKFKHDRFVLVVINKLLTLEFIIINK